MGGLNAVFDEGRKDYKDVFKNVKHGNTYKEANTAQKIELSDLLTLTFFCNYITGLMNGAQFFYMPPSGNVLHVEVINKAYEDALFSE